MEPINSNTSNQIGRYSPRQSDSVAAPEKTSSLTAAPKFVSPKGNIDPQSGVYVVQFRNASTGNVDFQYPNKKVVAEYVRSEKLVAKAPEQGAGQAPTSSAKTVEVAPGSQSSSAAAPPSSSGAGPAPAELGTTDNN